MTGDEVPVADNRCVLGVTAEDERTLVVLRDASGKVLGYHDATRT